MYLLAWVGYWGWVETPSFHVKWKSHDKTAVLHNLCRLLKSLERENYVVDVWLHIDHALL